MRKARFTSFAQRQVRPYGLAAHRLSVSRRRVVMLGFTAGAAVFIAGCNKKSEPNSTTSQQSSTPAAVHPAPVPVDVNLHISIDEVRAASPHTVPSRNENAAASERAFPFRNKGWISLGLAALAGGIMATRKNATMTAKAFAPVAIFAGSYAALWATAALFAHPIMAVAGAALGAMAGHTLARLYSTKPGVMGTLWGAGAGIAAVLLIF